MRLGIFAKTFPGDRPEPVLRAAREAGFEWVQWNMACSGLGALPTTIPQAAIREICEATEQTGVGLVAVSATYNMIHPDRAAREEGRAAFAAIAGAARAMGTGAITLCTGSRDAEDQWRHHPDNAGPEAWTDFLAEMRLVLPLARAAKVNVLVEPELANVVSSPQRALDMLVALEWPSNLGIVLDPANLSERAPDLATVEAAVNLLFPRISLAHAKDKDAEGRVVPAGQGVIDFEHFFWRLRTAAFDEGVVVTHGLSAADAPAAALHLLRCMGYEA